MFAKNIFYIHLRKNCYDDNTLCFLFECKDPDIWADFTQREDIDNHWTVEIAIPCGDLAYVYTQKVGPSKAIKLYFYWFDNYRAKAHIS